MHNFNRNDKKNTARQRFLVVARVFSALTSLPSTPLVFFTPGLYTDTGSQSTKKVMNPNCA